VACCSSRFFWRPLEQKWTVHLLLRASSPSEEVVFTAIDDASDQPELLWQLWRTQKLPHRQLVLNYLSKNVLKAGLLDTMEPLLISAAQDPDVEARQATLGILHQIRSPHLRQLAFDQMSDADPAVRLIGLQSLRQVATSSDVPGL
jgi:hypothetical protein